MKKIVTIVGARPQFIKAAAVSRVIAGSDGVQEVLVHTGQHFDSNMSDVFFEELDIRRPDFHLGVGGGSHGQNTGRMLESIEKTLLQEKPDWVLVYGDTDSTLAGALAAVKLHIPIAHVEAGLRSFNRRMPEEINRILTDHASSLLFAPTQVAVDNLKVEGIDGPKVKMVGDVMLDATLFYKDRAKRPEEVPFQLGNYLLCTIHRAENTDDPKRLSDILKLLNELAAEVPVVLPLHPRTQKAIEKLTGFTFHEQVIVIKPVSFLEMTWLLAHSSMVVTDSGGVQKEAYFHQKPCATLRDQTEWVELVEAGWNKLIFPEYANVFDVLNFKEEAPSRQVGRLYGDGKAASLIINNLLYYLK